jgi:hypothetical protein
MRTAKRVRCFPVVSASLSGLLSAGCLPIPTTVTLSPMLVGTIQHADGTPVTGASLMLAMEADSTCTLPALRSTTDSAGVFGFPAVRQREAYTVILADQLFCYQICGGQGVADPMYRTCYLNSVPPADSISCIEAIGQPPTGARAFRCEDRDSRRRRRSHRRRTQPLDLPEASAGLSTPGREEEHAVENHADEYGRLRVVGRGMRPDADARADAGTNTGGSERIDARRGACNR